MTLSAFNSIVNVACQVLPLLALVHLMGWTLGIATSYLKPVTKT